MRIFLSILPAAFSPILILVAQTATPPSQPQPAQQRVVYQEAMKGYDAQIAKLRATALARLVR